MRTKPKVRKGVIQEDLPEEDAQKVIRWYNDHIKIWNSLERNFQRKPWEDVPSPTALHEQGLFEASSSVGPNRLYLRRKDTNQGYCINPGRGFQIYHSGTLAVDKNLLDPERVVWVRRLVPDFYRYCMAYSKGYEPIPD